MYGHSGLEADLEVQQLALDCLVAAGVRDPGVDMADVRIVQALLDAASAIHEADIEANRVMGAWGAAQVQDATGLLTHCNTGSLATGGYGTALGVIRSAWAQGGKAIFDIPLCGKLAHE